jgi:hypothetical protein
MQGLAAQCKSDEFLFSAAVLYFVAEFPQGAEVLPI